MHSPIVKRCGCGKEYTFEQWLSLPFKGKSEPGAWEMAASGADPAAVLIHRDCSCGSTLTLQYDLSDVNFDDVREAA